MVFSDAELKKLSNGMSLAPLPLLPGGGEGRNGLTNLIFFRISKNN